MLQTAIDDSGNYLQGKTCLMAGCVASADEWKKFSARWAAVLDEAPALPYFKMSDAFALAKTFKLWKPEDRDAKVDRLIDVNSQPISRTR
jgi:hypothetical protein